MNKNLWISARLDFENFRTCSASITYSCITSGPFRWRHTTSRWSIVVKIVVSLMITPSQNRATSMVHGWCCLSCGWLLNSWDSYRITNRRWIKNRRALYRRYWKYFIITTARLWLVLLDLDYNIKLLIYSNFILIYTDI